MVQICWESKIGRWRCNNGGDKDQGGFLEVEEKGVRNKDTSNMDNTGNKGNKGYFKRQEYRPKTMNAQGTDKGKEKEDVKSDSRRMVKCIIERGACSRF